MRKIYKAALAMMIGVSAMAQTPFFTPTTFRGAFAPAPTNMWTDTWTEWDPQNHVYSAPTVTVTTDITVNTTWTSSNTYLIQGLIYVRNGATLTIQPGTTIMGDKGVANSSLVITKGAKINAAGTINQPIVFTSNQAAGGRNPGDWGGVIMLGKAMLNQPGDTANIEGISPTLNTQYGGGGSPDDHDNSGVLQYTRIEFAGYIFASNKEINALTLGAIGDATTIDHIQVSYCNDDAFEWFGGTVNCTHLVSYRNLDDDFDADFGYSGHVQYGLVVRDPSIADNPSVSTSEGFETDNDATGSNATPYTSGVFSNITLIGPYRGNTASSIATGYRRGARIRRNSHLKIFNSIFMDFPRGVHIDGTACEGLAASGGLKFKNNLIAGTSTGRTTEVNTGSTFNAPAWFATNMNDSLVATTGILVTPYNYTAPDYRPDVSSPALSNADFTDATFCGWVINNMSVPSISGTLAFCSGGNTTLSGPTVSSGYTYMWSANAGSATTQTVSVNSADTYTLTITDPYCNTVSNTISTTVNSLPNVSITGVTTICEGSNTTLFANGASTYSWTGGSTNTSITLNPTTTTSYTLTGTDGNGCTNTATSTVNVNTLAVMGTTPTVGSSNCGASTGSVTGAVITGNGTLTYDWTDASNNTVGSAIDLSNVAAGVYNLTVTDGNGCEVTFGPYSVSNPGAPAVPTITIADTTVCVGDAVAFTANTSGSGITYQWTGPGSSSSSATLNIASATTANSGSYAVTATSAGCTSAAASVQLIVNQLPNVGAVATNSLVCNQDGANALIGFPSGGTFSGTGVSGNNFMPTSVSVGTYTVTYMYTDANGCSNSATATVQVDPCAGIAEAGQLFGGVNLFPNPANNEVNIVVGEMNDNISFTVINGLGQVVESFKSASANNVVKLNTSDYNNGLYFVNITDDNGNKMTIRFVISK